MIRKPLLKLDLYARLEAQVTSIILKCFYRKTFLYNKKELNYFIHPKNATYSNERMIEIPIVNDFLKGEKPSEVLTMSLIFTKNIQRLHLTMIF